MYHDETRFVWNKLNIGNRTYYRQETTNTEYGSRRRIKKKPN